MAHLSDADWVIRCNETFEFIKDNTKIVDGKVTVPFTNLLKPKFGHEWLGTMYYLRESGAVKNISKNDNNPTYLIDMKRGEFTIEEIQILRVRVAALKKKQAEERALKSKKSASTVRKSHTRVDFKELTEVLELVLITLKPHCDIDGYLRSCTTILRNELNMSSPERKTDLLRKLGRLELDSNRKWRLLNKPTLTIEEVTNAYKELKNEKSKKSNSNNDSNINPNTTTKPFKRAVKLTSPTDNLEAKINKLAERLELYRLELEVQTDFTKTISDERDALRVTNARLEMENQELRKQLLTKGIEQKIDELLEEYTGE